MLLLAGNFHDRRGRAKTEYTYKSLATLSSKTSAIAQPIPSVDRAWYRSHYLWVGLFCVALTLVYTARVWGNLWTVVPGGDVDGFENVWNNWLVRKSLLDWHVSPFFTDYIYYPTGVSLRLHALQPLNGLLTIPLAPLFGPLASTNLTFIWAIFSTAFFGYLLFYYLTRQPWAALVAASLWGFCNWQQYEFFAAGQGNLVSLEWLPLYLLFMLKVGRGDGTKQRRWLNIGLAALVLLALTLTDLQYLIFAVLITGLYGVYVLFTRQTWREKGLSWLRLAIVGAVYGGVALPTIIIPAAIEAANSPWLWPTSDQSIAKAVSLFDYAGWENHNLGYVALILAGLGLVVSWRKAGRDGRFWLLVAGVFGLLSFGPILQMRNHPLKIGESTLTMPYAWLRTLPGMQVGRNPSLYQVVWMLAIAVLAAYGVGWLVEKFGQSKLQLRAGLTTGLVLVTVSPLLISAAQNYQLDSLNVSPFYEKLAQDKDDYAILDIPSFTYSGRGEDVYQGFQVIHNKARFGGRLSRDHKLDNPNNFLKTNTLFRDFYWLGERAANDFNNARDFVAIPSNAEIGLPLLNRYKVKYIVLYKQALNADTGKVAQQLVNEVLNNPKPVYEDAQLAAYAVPQGQPYTQNNGLFADVGDGWYTSETQNNDTWRWAKSPDKAELYLYNMKDTAQEVDLSFLAYSFKTERELSVQLNGRELNRYQLNGERQAVDLKFRLEPGRSVITFSTLQPALSVADFGFKNDSRTLSFGLVKVVLKAQPN